MPAFAIHGQGITAVGGDDGVTVAFAGGGEAMLISRQAHRFRSNGPAESIDTLIAELDGVRVYLRRRADGHLDVIVTRLDL